MKSDLEVFGSDEPMTGLLAIGCSNDDYDPYAPPLRKQSLKEPIPMDNSAPKGKATRAASTSQHGQKDTVPARRPVQIGKALHLQRCMQKEVADNVTNIAGQYDNYAVSPHGSNFNANDEPGTNYGRGFRGNNENQAGDSYGRGINTNADNSGSRDHTANADYGSASTSYDRPVNTNINQPRSPYERALSPTTNAPSSPYGSTYGSAKPEPAARRPGNLTGAASHGQHERVGKSTTSSLPSPRGREFPNISEAPTSPHARAGNSGHTTIPENSSTGAGGISESLGHLKLKDDNRGTQ